MKEPEPILRKINIILKGNLRKPSYDVAVLRIRKELQAMVPPVIVSHKLATF
jgi:hypothetical protein